MEGLGCEQLARESGFQERAPRKISAPNFIKALGAQAYLPHVSLNTLAIVQSKVSGVQVSKQGVDKRLGPEAILFLGNVLLSGLHQLSQAGWSGETAAFSSFNHVLIQDSTHLRLPDELADLFPGSRNQSGQPNSLLKIQMVYDLLSDGVRDLSLSGFTRNDQEAAADILDRAEPGDLVLRDLGYFSGRVFRQMDERGVFFLSRLQSRVALYDPDTGARLDLEKELRRSPVLDRKVLLGSKEKMKVRLVAAPVPNNVANERRRKAKSNRDRRCAPSRSSLKLLGWEIFITNVDKEVWSTQTAAKAYFSRWRIELVFKVWKSHFGVAAIPRGSNILVLACILARLIHMIWFHNLYDLVNHQAVRMTGRHISMQKFADFLNVLTVLESIVLKDDQNQKLNWEIILALCSYDKRKRKNYFQKLMALS